MGRRLQNEWGLIKYIKWLGKKIWIEISKSWSGEKIKWLK